MKSYIKYRQACRRMKKQDKERDRQIREINERQIDPNWSDGLDPVEIQIIDGFTSLKNLKFRSYPFSRRS